MERLLISFSNNCPFLNYYFLSVDFLKDMFSSFSYLTSHVFINSRKPFQPSHLFFRPELKIAAVPSYPIYPLLTAISAQAVILPSFGTPKHVFVARRIIFIKEKLHCSILALIVYFHSIVSYTLPDNAE